MKVIICGAGRVGFAIARQLASENNDVVIIDRSAELVRSISDTLDVSGVVGFASRPDVLKEAGADDAEMIIAVTYADEVNMVACQVAHSVFNIPRKIARVRAQSYLEPRWRDMFRRDHMPIDVIISPEVEVAETVLRRLGAPGTFETTPFLDDRVRLIGTRLPPDCSILNTPMRHLLELFPGIQLRIVGVERQGKLHTPNLEDQLLEGDAVFFIAAKEHIERSLALFGLETTAARRIVIAGGGNIGLAVAEALESDDRRVKAKLIEKDRSRAEFVAERLERTIVLNGDALDAAVLDEANIAESEMLVALTDDDKTNLLAGVLAKQAGADTAMALVNNPNLLRLAGPLGLEGTINPRATTVSSILRHVRRGRIKALHSVRDGAAEVIEAQILPTSPLAGKMLKDVTLPSGVVIGAVQSGTEVQIPTSSYVFRDGDMVVTFALKRSVVEAEKLFRVSVDYF